MFALLLSLAAGPSVSQYDQGSQDDGTHPRSLTGERVDTTENSPKTSPEPDQKAG